MRPPPVKGRPRDRTLIAAVCITCFAGATLAGFSRLPQRVSISLTNGGGAGEAPSRCKPGGHVPVIAEGGVLRGSATTLQDAPLQPGDVTVFSVFLDGSCLVGVLSRPRGLDTNYSARLRVDVETLDGAPLHSPVQWSSRRWYEPAKPWEAEQGTATLTFCSDVFASARTTRVRIGYPLPQHPNASVWLDAARLPPPHRPPHHTAICSFFRGVTGEHLALWLAYHVRLGIGHAFLYLNEPWEAFLARPGVAAVLDRVLAPVRVTFIAWASHPMYYPGDDRQHVGQNGALNDCYRRFSRHATHFLFTDVDEFVYVDRSALPPAVVTSDPQRNGSSLSVSSGRRCRGCDLEAAASLGIGGRSRCALLPNTWGLVEGTFPLTLAGLLSADIVTAGANKPMKHDGSALSRTKTYTAGAHIGVVGNHNLLTWADGRTSDCVAADAARIGFLHLMSAQLASTRPASSTVSRNNSALAAEIRGHPDAHRTALLSGSLLSGDALLMAEGAAADRALCELDNKGSSG